MYSRHQIPDEAFRFSGPYAMWEMSKMFGDAPPGPWAIQTLVQAWQEINQRYPKVGDNFQHSQRDARVLQLRICGRDTGLGREKGRDLHLAPIRRRRQAWAGLPSG
jgi:hypothetical protein